MGLHLGILKSWKSECYTIVFFKSSSLPFTHDELEETVVNPLICKLFYQSPVLLLRTKYKLTGLMWMTNILTLFFCLLYGVWGNSRAKPGIGQNCPKRELSSFFLFVFMTPNFLNVFWSKHWKICKCLIFFVNLDEAYV